MTHVSEFCKPEDNFIYIIHILFVVVKLAFKFKTLQELDLQHVCSYAAWFDVAQWPMHFLPENDIPYLETPFCCT